MIHPAELGFVLACAFVTTIILVGLVEVARKVDQKKKKDD